MGLGQITAGGPNGRYTLRLDYGEGVKNNTVAALNAQLAKLDADIVAVQAILATKQTTLDGEAAAVQSATEIYIAATRAATAPELEAQSEAIKSAAQTAYEDAQAARALAQSELTAAESALTALDAQIATLTADKTAAQAAYTEAEALALEASAQVGLITTQLASAQTAANVAEAAYLAKVQAEEDATAEAQAMGAAQALLSARQQQLDVARQEYAERAADVVPLADDLADIEANLAAAIASRPDAVELVEVRTIGRNVTLASERVAEMAAQQARESNTVIQQTVSLQVKQGNALQQLLNAKLRLLQAQRDMVPGNLQLLSSKAARAQVLDLITRWSAAVVVQTKDAWCTDLTENGAGYVATIDINGESDLTLIAPGCRAWVGGDGAILTAVKNAKLSALNDLKARHDASLARVQAEITSLTAAVASAKTALDAAFAELIAAPPGDNQYAERYNAAAERWRDFTAELATQTVELSRVEARIAAVAKEILEWNAKPSSDEPRPGDGVMRATDVMSAAEYFYNVSCMPGWQKWKPTYRWGTITALDKDADTCTINLAAASSSQQNLGINQASVLSNVPVLYMTCNASAFEEGDRAVVEFQGQDWSRPRVIGFLDNPKPCLQYTASYYVIGYGPLSSGNNHLFDTVEQDKDEEWGDFTTITPVAPWKFIQWSDGVSSLTRNDGTATENISRTARYTYAPNFRVQYTWTVEAYATSGAYFSDGNFVKDWEVKVTGSVTWTAIGYATPPTSPATATIDNVVWSGQALSSIGPDQVMFNLTDTYLGETSSAGPIYFPASYPSSSTQTAVFILAGSANEYTVNGTAGSNPFPGGVIPATGSGTGALTTIDYTATTWSAVYP